MKEFDTKGECLTFEDSARIERRRFVYKNSDGRYVDKVRREIIYLFSNKHQRGCDNLLFLSLSPYILTCMMKKMRQ